MEGLRGKYPAMGIVKDSINRGEALVETGYTRFQSANGKIRI